MLACKMMVRVTYLVGIRTVYSYTSWFWFPLQTSTKLQAIQPSLEHVRISVRIDGGFRLYILIGSGCCFT